MPKRIGKSTAAGLLVILLAAGVTRAGDYPFFLVRDWGVGKINNRLMFYVGKGRYLDTPIPATDRWLFGYVVVGAGGVALLIVKRWRHRVGTIRRGFDVSGSPTT